MREKGAEQFICYGRGRTEDPKVRNRLMWAACLTLRTRMMSGPGLLSKTMLGTYCGQGLS